LAFGKLILTQYDDTRKWLYLTIQEPIRCAAVKVPNLTKLLI
jgi:hypothetical protein